MARKLEDPTLAQSAANASRGFKDQKDRKDVKRSPNHDGQKTKNSGSRKRQRRNREDRNATTNSVLNGTNIETPVTGTSLLFPSDCASMQAFGNYTTTPGQDNFITDYNAISRSVTATDLPITIKASANARRTANAMRLDVTSLFGAANPDSVGLWENPIMLAATNLKQYCDTSFGTNTNYSPQDLAIYLMAVAACFPLFAELRRDIRLAVTYIQNQYPQFIPQGLFALLAIPDESDPARPYANGEGAMYVSKHLRSLIDQYNQMVITFNRLPIPPEISLFGYNDDLFECIYMDSMDINTAQLYVFHNSVAWWYREGLSPEGACLFPLNIGENSMTRKLYLLSEMLKSISALRTDSRAMLQNLFNAYGSRDLLHIPTIDMNDLRPLDFVYEPGMLSAIENLVLCNPQEVGYSRYQALSYSTNVNFHLWAKTALRPTCMFNIPLQFHKPYAEINQLDIGWAMRFHPSFRKQLKFETYEEGDTPVTLSHVVADGNYGFAIVEHVFVCTLGDSGELVKTELTSQNWATNSEVYLKMLDFAYRPMLVSFSAEHAEETDPYVFTISHYTASRDVECTYRLEDTHMMWIYLTQSVWASNINRAVSGTRTHN